MRIASILLALAVLAFVGCGQSSAEIEETTIADSESAPPTPTPMPVEELHKWLLEDRDLNPSRSKSREERGEVYRFTGEVTGIEDMTAQFHIERRTLRRDIYVECVFPSDEEFWELNVGDVAAAQGYLTSIGDAVKFERCEVLSIE